MANAFFLIFLLTVIITRLFVFYLPISSPTFGKLRIHHYMYGIILIFISFLFSNLIVYAIGLGLFVDELTYLLIRGKTHKDNYSIISLSGTLFFVILIFLLRNYLVLLF